MVLPKRHPAVVTQDVSEGTVLLHTEQEVYYGLNGVGLEIWELMASCARVDDVVVALEARYPEVGRDRIRGDVEALVADLSSAGLVVPTPSAAP